MSDILTEKEKALLSAYHDGELSGTEYAEAEHLLGSSTEAQAWLEDASRVRSLSIDAAIKPTFAVTDKLTGSAIATAAARGGGRGVVSTLTHSSWGITGAVGLLVIGAIFLTDPFGTGENPEAGLPANALAYEASVAPVSSLEPEDAAVTVPPISARDLVSFALQGTLPTNAERTEYVAFSADGASDERMAREIESGLGNLGKGHLRTLDSLAELLRTAVLKKNEGTYAVRQDLSALREEVIEQMQEAPLSSDARTTLQQVQNKARVAQKEADSRLVAEMDRMREQLLDWDGPSYFVISGQATTEKPTGDRHHIIDFRKTGVLSNVMIINPDGLHFAEKNPKLIASLPETVPTRTVVKQRSGSSARVANAKSASSQTDESHSGTMASGGVQENSEENPNALSQETAFLMEVSINLQTSTHSQIIISEDDEKWFVSPLAIGVSSDTFYKLGDYLMKLTDSLNATVSRIAIDTAASARERAEQIFRVQQDYRQRVKAMIERIQEPQQVDSTESYDDAADVDMERVPKMENMRQEEENTSELDRDEESAQILLPCPPWENCTGVS